MKDLLLIGGGGHCKSVIDSIEELKLYNIVGILDLKEKVGTKINGVEVIGEDKDLAYFHGQGIEYAFVTLGSIAPNKVRAKLYNSAVNAGYTLPTIIDRTANVSKSAEIGQGTFIGKGSIVNTDTSIGDNCIINTGTIIEHDCNISHHCHIAPGTTMSGSVSIGQHTHIGTNATLIQNIKIGSHTLIGAGSVVVNNIGENLKAFGNPCREVL